MVRLKSPPRPEALVAAVMLFALVGCGDAWGTAEGTITVEGKPLMKGLVTFQPAESGAPAYATVTEAGTFIAMTGAKPGLKPGDYTVTVIDQTIPTPGTTEVARLLTPEKYASVQTSDLKVSVKPGPNKLAFDLKR